MWYQAITLTILFTSTVCIFFLVPINLGLQISKLGGIPVPRTFDMGNATGTYLSHRELICQLVECIFRVLVNGLE